MSNCRKEEVGMTASARGMAPMLGVHGWEHHSEFIRTCTGFGFPYFCVHQTTFRCTVWLSSAGKPTYTQYKNPQNILQSPCLRSCDTLSLSCFLLLNTFLLTTPYGPSQLAIHTRSSGLNGEHKPVSILLCS